MLPYIKPLHTIGKVYVNASILYKTQEICNKNQPVKISAHFIISFTRKQQKCIQHFCIHSDGRSFRLIIGSYFTNYSKTITHQAEIFQGKLSNIVIFIPCKLCVNLFFGLTNVVL